MMEERERNGWFFNITHTRNARCYQMTAFTLMCAYIFHSPKQTQQQQLLAASLPAPDNDRIILIWLDAVRPHICYMIWKKGNQQREKKKTAARKKQIGIFHFGHSHSKCVSKFGCLLTLLRSLHLSLSLVRCALLKSFFPCWSSYIRNAIFRHLQYDLKGHITFFLFIASTRILYTHTYISDFVSKSLITRYR